MGLDADKLESLRVSASKSSPMGDTLELCSRYTDAAALDALLPRLTQLVRRGVGLNTRCCAWSFAACWLHSAWGQEGSIRVQSA